MKSIIICADDYGATEGISAGIRELTALGRLTAVSCLASSSAWPEEACALKPFRDEIDVGLHFSLTLGFAQSVPLASWITKSLAGRIDIELVRQEFIRQLRLFELAWERPPDFIDGHHHIHIFPGIRKVIFQTLTDRFPAKRRPWVRRVNPPLTGHDAPAKAMILKILSIGFARDARQAGLTFSRNFAGLYSQSAQADFPALMTGWLRRARPGTVLMCHPSNSDSVGPEGTGKACFREFMHLRSKEFAATIKKEKITPVRFTRL